MERGSLPLAEAATQLGQFEVANWIRYGLNECLLLSQRGCSHLEGQADSMRKPHLSSAAGRTSGTHEGSLLSAWAASSQL